MGEIVKTEEAKNVIMIKSGATREKTWSTVARALEATKMTVDKFGEEHVEEDHAIRLRAAELIARANGDIKPDGGITNNIAITPTVSKEDMMALMTFVKAQAARDRSRDQTGEIIDVSSYKS